MDQFRYLKSQLFVEGVAVKEISSSIGTPFYCYSSSILENNYLAFANAVKALDAEICYSVKANSNIAVVATLARLGAGADVVSVGELERALFAGVPAGKIIFSGVGKTAQELKFAVEQGIKQINVESEPELHALSEIAAASGKTINVALRINPDIDAKTHEKITTGKSENKFGIDFEKARNLFLQMSKPSGLSLSGIAIHIGSQITSLEPYRQAYAHLAEFVKLLRSDGVEISNLDLGGGLGIKYYEENTPTPSDYGAMVQEILGGLGCSFSFEPGRIISGDSGILVSKVIYLKETASKTFCIVDAAMNDFIRPTLYEAYHDILKVDEPKRHDVTKIFQIVGPICESGDYFAKNRELPKINQGDLIALKTVGAYGAVMSSCYNSRPLIPEVMVRNDQYSIIRERETIKDIIKKEKIPQWM